MSIVRDNLGIRPCHVRQTLLYLHNSYVTTHMYLHVTRYSTAGVWADTINEVMPLAGGYDMILASSHLTPNTLEKFNWPGTVQTANPDYRTSCGLLGRGNL